MIEREGERVRRRGRESKEERVRDRQGKRDAVALVNLSNLSSYSLDQAESDWYEYRRIDLVHFSIVTPQQTQACLFKNE